MFETALMKIGILEPPPISYIEEQGIDFSFRSLTISLKKVWIVSRAGAIIL